MRGSFTADTATFDEIERAFVAGLATGDGSQGYLVFQRSLPDDSRDEGVYLEYNDQACSGYNLIASCRLSRERLELDLSRPLGDLNDVTGIDVELHVDDASYEQFSRGLKQVFRGQAEGWLTND
jgi:hypothetical protein